MAQLSSSNVYGDLLVSGDVLASGEIRAARVFNSIYNDYAEYFEKENQNDFLDAGDIIGLSEETGKYIKAVNPKLIVGVVSDEYAHCIGGLGDGRDDLTHVPVGLAGRVNVKVVGPIHAGDLITLSDIPGVGKAVTTYVPGTVIGKALETNTQEGFKKVRMLILNA